MNKLATRFNSKILSTYINEFNKRKNTILVTVQRMCTLHDGRTLVSGSKDKTIRLWQPSSV